MLKSNIMNKKHIKYLQGSVIGAACIAAFASCTDDHFDVNPDVAGRTTLWENIQSNENLSQFAEILSKVHYSKSKGVSTPQTYSDLLNHDQTFTVWAPENGAFNYTYYMDLINSEDVDSLYKVETNLLQNHITRFSKVMSGADSTDITLLNNKVAVFNSAKGTIKGAKIVDANIGASNGILHVVDGNIAYQPNIYEYFESVADLDSLSKYLKSTERTEFNEYASTQGPTINGEITWVDSVMYTTNDYFNISRAYINSEDSLYVMIMPTNKAWKEGLDKAAPFFNYKKKYTQQISSTTADGTVTTTTETTEFSDVEFDSLKNAEIKGAMAGSLVFNAKYQYGYNYAQFPIEGACDSLTSTNGVTFYKPYCARLFDGNTTPVTLSNGYGYIVDNYNYVANQTWMSDRMVEAEYTTNVETYTRCTPSAVRYYKNITGVLNEEGDTIAKDSTIEIRVMKTIQTSSASNPDVTFKLRNLLSGTYDIYVLVAYNDEAKKPNRFTARLSYHNEDRDNATTETLKVPEGGAGSGSYFENRPTCVDENGNACGVDSVLLAKDFKFPVCYYGLDNAYVTLKLASYVSSSQTSTYTRELWIDKIVLIAKDE